MCRVSVAETARFPEDFDLAPIRNAVADVIDSLGPTASNPTASNPTASNAK